MVLDKYGAMTRTELMKLMKVKRTTLYDNLEELEENNEVKREIIERETRGRPKILWSVNLD